MTTALANYADKHFWPRVAKGDPDGCWLWTGAVVRRYGQVLFRGAHYRTHRLAWELSFGPIPDGLCVCHRCDVPLCVNPGHLFLGTVGDNTRDMAAKGRHPQKQKTHCPRGHAYTEENTVRRRGFRECRACIRELRRARDARHRARKSA